MLTLEKSDIQAIIQKQREFFATGKTKDVSFRQEQLKKLKQLVLDNVSAISQALKADLNKSEEETYLGEISIIAEIDYAIKHIKNWAKPKKADVPIQLFSYAAKIYPEPLGVALIISPWNYPFALMIGPLVGAITAGNCAILKPSEIAAHTSTLLNEIISKNFPREYIAVVEGGVQTSQALLAEKFDHIFFTGGTGVGKIIMEAAAKHLTPVTLELGGKTPCIVDSNIDLEQSARRITWGKFLNSGQTCVAPDYLLVNQKIKSDLLAAIKENIKQFYGDNPELSPDYGRIISHNHFDRLAKFLNNGEIITGGQTNRETKYIAPTLLDKVSLSEPVMQEEIFGPILPIIEYTDIQEAIALINSQPKPLALYIFSRDENLQKRILQQTSSGGVCINDTIVHLGVSSLPFGGVGESGMGSYHGKAGFDTFSHYKSVLKNSFWLDLNWRYPPYAGKLSFLKKFIA